MSLSEQFFSLTPDRVLDAVERALDSLKAANRATGRTLVLNSMENRVYEIELDDATRVVAKFYRPGRWTRETILEEHAFAAELVEHEVPAVPPLKLPGTSGGAETLSQTDDGILFAVFPKVRGRILQELDDSRLMMVGRLLARLHNIGATKPAPHRLPLTAQHMALTPLELLESTGLLPAQFAARYRALVEAIVAETTPRLKAARQLRIHGDCHLGNVLWQDGAPFFLDFDDMLTGPAVQDIWLVVRGRDEEARRQREVLLRSYESMREFDWNELALIEGLRALRMVHYSGWIARRWEDPTFKNAFPDFGTQKYWVEEITDLDEQLRQLQGTSDTF